MSIEDKDDVAEIEVSTTEENLDKEKGDPPADSLRILEALLFASDEILTSSRLKAILPDNPDARQIRKMVEKINAILQKERHPFEIVEIGGGYQFRTVSYYHPWVRQIFKEKAAKKLSVQSLECLAIIAYKQPLSKAEIEAIRGVVSDGAMKTLLEKRLVTITGRSDKPGRPLQYGTTLEFLKYFGLNKIEDLPRLEEFEAIAREKISELSIDELQTEQATPGSEEESPVSDTEIVSRQENVEAEAASQSEKPADDASFEVTEDTTVEPRETVKPKQAQDDDDSAILSETVDIQFEDSSETEESSDSESEATFESQQSIASSASSLDKSKIEAASVFSNPVLDYNDEFVFNDGITEDEMTETAIQARETEIKSKDTKDKESDTSSQKDAAVSQDEEVLEVFMPPPKSDDEGEKAKS